MKVLFCFALLLSTSIFSGCGSTLSSTSTASTTPTTPSSTPAAASSVWAGTYTGILEFAGCPTENACGGDSVTMTIAESPNPSIPGEFLPVITATGTDMKSGQIFTGTGSAVYDGAAPVGPGTEDTFATITTTLGDSLSLHGTGDSTTTAAVDIQTVVVNNSTTANGITIIGAYLGTLTRQASGGNQ